MNTERITSWARVVLAVGLAGIFSGCNSFGPNSVRGTHFQYNRAIVTSLDEQFLHNLVRLRYRDTPYFLEIGSVTASLKMEASVGGEAAFIPGGIDIFTPNAGIGYSNSPTISYAPLSGDDFLKNVLSPITLDSLFVLTQSGWSTGRVFGLCVERISDLDNAPSASGPTPATPPMGYENFQKLLDLLESRRNKELIRTARDPKTDSLVIQMKASSGDESAVREIKRLLNIDPNKSLYTVDSDFVETSSDSISIRTRSIMSILFYLSQNVDTPRKHEESGYVNVTRNADGTPFDWSATPGGSMFKVQSSMHRPKSAYLSVPYRGYWFYIADNDLESKSTFMLITQLFNLQAGDVKSMAPTLTIPVGN